MRAELRFIAALVESGRYVWATRDREPMPEDYEPTREELERGEIIALRRAAVERQDTY